MSQSRGAESAHTDHHSVVRQEKGSRGTCAKRQVRSSTDEALASGENADHKCMLETL